MSLRRRLVSVALAACLLVATVASAQERVDTKAALAQVVKKVDPVWPAAAAAAKVGGLVVADVTIDVDGRVSAVTILGGPEPLHAAARAALRQWTFKPFLRNGRPRIVTAIIDVNFPDPLKDEEQQNRDELHAARIACERALELNPSWAVALCKEAVTISEKVPSIPTRQTYDEVEQTLRAYLRSLIATSQLQDAIGVARRLVARRGTIEDSIVAEYVTTLAVLQQRAGANDDAEASFAKVHALYDVLARESTSSAGKARQALQDHAALRRARGDSAGAADLDRRAAAITVREPSETPLRRTTRRLDGITIVETKPAFVTAEDLLEIRALIAPKRAWWIWVDETYGVEAQPALGVQVCVEPDVVTATFHRGTCIFMAKRTATAGRAEVWSRGRSAPLSDEYAYLRVPQDGTDPSTQPPLKLDPYGNLPVPPDETIADAVRFIRRQAVPRPTSRQRNDVQPWPAETLWVTRDQLILITRSADASAGQMITLKRQGNDWEIVELR